MRRFLLVLLAVSMFCAAAYAQDYPRAEAFVGYAYMRAVVSGPSATNMGGWGAEANFNATKSIGLVASFSGDYKTLSGVSLHQYDFLFGPQFTYRSADSHIAPFARILFGGAQASAGFSGLAVTQSAFAWGIGGGVDINITKHFGIRPFSADYIQTRFNSNAENNIRIMVGVKIH